MKHWEEIRYYALKTTAASSTFIIGWIFIIKNFSSWVTAAEYFGPAQATKVFTKMVCAYLYSMDTICLPVYSHTFLAILSVVAVKSNTKRFSLSYVRLFIAAHMHITHRKRTHCCTNSSGEDEKYMQSMYKKPWSWLYNAQFHCPTPYVILTGPHSQ